MLSRRGFLGALMGVGAGLLPVRAIGRNPWDVPGALVSEGLASRIVDPVTGVGLFNPNLDPNVVGQDVDGVDYPTGTDMGPGAPFRRQMHTNIINGDFSAGPPGGAGSVINSDPADADYNPLPGWRWVPDAAGLLAATWDASTAVPTHKAVSVSYPSGTAHGDAYLEQLVSVPASAGRMYLYRLTAFLEVFEGGSAGAEVRGQFLKADAVTTTGSEFASTLEIGTADASTPFVRAPADAEYLRVRLFFASGTWVGGPADYLVDVRLAVIPAEVVHGLQSITANSDVVDASPEVSIISATIPANTFVIGSVYTIVAYADISDTAPTSRTLTVRCRIGPTTLTGTVVATANPSTTGTASSSGYKVEVTVTVRAVGASGTVNGTIEVIGGGSEPFSNVRRIDNDGDSTIDTTVANLLELTAQTSNNGTTTTFRQAYIRCEMAS